ncbi:MAG: helix-turn-helix domain-containing protein [Alphaproteobacteria bacterium]
MGSYRHLTRDDRDEIAVLHVAGHANAEIAASTISRALRRNALDCGG